MERVMSVARKVDTEHKDLIHDVAFDFYGSRMATCSSDQTIRIWEMDEGTKDWACSSFWKGHSGAVWKVTWAHPEYGQVLASCSFDRTVVVWEQPANATHWSKRATLVDSRGSVSDVKFGPLNLGLILATCSADGNIRIYEPANLMNLTEWSLQYEIPVKMSCSCISWNPTYPGHFPPMLAVGSDVTTRRHSTLTLFEFDEANRRWNKADSLPNVKDPVNDISFAPNMGRSHHVLAIASKDVKIVVMEPQPVKGKVPKSPTLMDTTTVAQCNDHRATVWRVAWNCTGTILASSGDDGCVRLWKANDEGIWKCVTILSVDGVQLPVPATPTPASPPPPQTPPTFRNIRFLVLGAAAAVQNDVVWH